MVGMEGNCRKVKGWEVTEMQIMMSGKVQAKSKKKILHFFILWRLINT